MNLSNFNCIRSPHSIQHLLSVRDGGVQNSPNNHPPNRRLPFPALNYRGMKEPVKSVNTYPHGLHGIDARTRPDDGLQRNQLKVSYRATSSQYFQ